MRIWLMKTTSVLVRLMLAVSLRRAWGQLVAHFAFDFGLRREGGDGVDDDDVDSTRAHQHVGDFERLFAGVGLGDQQFADIHAKFLGVGDVEGVFGVDEGGGAAEFLHFGDDLEGQGRLPGGFRAVDFDDATAGQAADSEGDVEAQGAGRDGLDVAFDLSVAEAHDRALAELLFDLGKRGGESLGLVVIHLS